MKEILWLPSWYPSVTNPQNGDFIFRHALAVSNLIKIKLIFFQVVPNGQKTSKNTRVVNDRFVEYLFLSRSCSFWKFVNFFKYFACVRREIKFALCHGHMPDLVHVNVSFKAGLVAFWLKRRYGIPFVLTEHWTFFTKERIDNYENSNFLFRCILKLIFNNASIVLPVSENLNKQLKIYFPNIKSEVIPNVVNPRLFFCYKNEPINSRFHFIHVSSLKQLKNPVGIIKVFSNLKAKYERVRLDIVGPASHAFIKTVRDLGYFNDSLSFLGQKEHYEVAKLMRESDAFVLFSSSENLPCVIAESLCCGVPVISSSVGGVPEMITEENGILVPPGDEDALYKALESMILNYKKYDRQKISETAQAKYNPDVVGKQIVEVYEKVLSKK